MRNTGGKAAYFDAIAAFWDSWGDPASQRATLGVGLAELGVSADEVVLDVGCGTGNLTAALLKRLSPSGWVAAVDVAPGMILQARRKVQDPRVEWLVADVHHLPFSQAFCHRAICLAVWPHLEAKEKAAGELKRVLRPGGWLHIWHLNSRQEVNRIHARAGGAIGEDLLPPAEETAAVLERCGFAVVTVVDDDRYLVTAAAPGSK